MSSTPSRPASSEARRSAAAPAASAARCSACFTLGVINNLLNLVGVKSFYQDIVKGTVIILAVLLVARAKA